MAKLSALAKAYQEMEANNPKHSHSHETEDWVIENFMDRVFALGYKGKPDKVVEYWDNRNKDFNKPSKPEVKDIFPEIAAQGLRSTKVELTPDEIKYLTEEVTEMHHYFPDNELFNGLLLKLRTAAEETIVGD